MTLKAVKSETCKSEEQATRSRTGSVATGSGLDKAQRTGSSVPIVCRIKAETRSLRAALDNIQQIWTSVSLFAASNVNPVASLPVLHWITFNRLGRWFRLFAAFKADPVATLPVLLSHLGLQIGFCAQLLLGHCYDRRDDEKN